jgi:serine protease DegQ
MTNFAASQLRSERRGTALCRQSAALSLAKALLVLSRLATMAFAIATGGSAVVHAGAPFDVVAQVAGVPTLAPILNKITPAVVTIVTKSGSSAKTRTKGRRNPHGPEIAAERKISSAGSGVVFDAPQGLIVTNYHVIANAVEMTVMLIDGRELPAKLVGTDAETDLAIIKVQADNLTALPLDGSDRIEVGDFVFAVGDPLHLGQTVTSGIVGGLHRRNVGVARYQDFIQTDAAIYPGNSGGALVNGRGDLVGINTAFVRPGRDNSGVAFAIPITLVRSVVEEILTYGEIRRGELGIDFDDPNPDKKPLQRSGALIVGVDKGSAAEHAGLRSGDVVIALGETSLRNASDLENRLGLLRVGDIAELTVVRKGIPTIVRATMRERDRRAIPK